MSRNYHGTRPVPIEDPDELRAVEHIRGRLAKVPELLERWNKVAGANASPKSQLARDDEVTGWLLLSSYAHHNLNHASDCLRALKDMIPMDEARPLPFVAHYPIARSGLEAASLALWILHPDDPQARIERHLRNVWREISDETSLMKASEDVAPPELGPLLDKQRKSSKAWKKKYVNQIRTAASRAGVVDPTLSSYTVGFAEIVNGASSSTGLLGGYGEMVWRMISGLSHPSMLRAVRFMPHMKVADHGNGVHGVQITNNMATLQFTVDALVLHFHTAVETLARRKIQIGSSAR